MADSQTGEASRPGPRKRKPPVEFQNPSIHNPLVDCLCVGGLSILVITGFLVYLWVNPEMVSQFKPDESASAEVEQQPESSSQGSTLLLSDQSGINNLLLMFWLTVLLNNPHFMASYRLLYRSREQVSQYRWSSIYMPLLLLGAAGFCLLGQTQVLPGGGVLSQASEILLQALGAVASLYLAWHYNGQAWGMTASFLYMAGIRVTRYERSCIRSAYWSLTAFHVLWSLSLFLRGNEMLAQTTDAVFVLSLLMIPVGIHGFRSVSRRTRKRVPWAALLPWIAIYFWYGLVYMHDYALIFLQLSHSLQYLCFTSRVEINLANRKPSRSKLRMLGMPFSVCLLYLVMLGSGWLVFELYRFVPMTTPQEKALWVGLGLLGVIVNIHHYFVDGTIWKISNPKVRRDLFAHLKPL